MNSIIYAAENERKKPDYSVLDGFVVHGHVRRMFEDYMQYDDYLELATEQSGLEKEQLKKIFIPYVLEQNRRLSGPIVFLGFLFIGFV